MLSAFSFSRKRYVNSKTKSDSVKSLVWNASYSYPIVWWPSKSGIKFVSGSMFRSGLHGDTRNWFRIVGYLFKNVRMCRFKICENLSLDSSLPNFSTLTTLSSSGEVGSIRESIHHPWKPIDILVEVPHVVLFSSDFEVTWCILKQNCVQQFFDGYGR